MRGLSHLIIVLTTCLLLVVCVGCSSDDRETAQPPASVAKKDHAPVTLVFNGGPPGGTFNYFANKMSSLITDETKWINTLPKGSGGSLDNICALNREQADMAIVYAGDAFLGRNGKLDCSGAPRDNVRAMAYLYGAPAQLVVRKDSDITSVNGFKGKTVAVGNPGSGAALAAERFFKHLKLWDEIDHRFLGYSQAAADFVAGKVDGFWVLVGYPNASIIEAATHVPIRLINLHRVGVVSGFYDFYPFYAYAEIPANTYEGQDEPVATFQDSALWSTRNTLDEEVVYNSLKAVFCKQGLEAMRKAHKAARDLETSQGISHLSIPLHPGAARFWAEKGLEIPSILLP